MLATAAGYVRNIDYVNEWDRNWASKAHSGRTIQQARSSKTKSPYTNGVDYIAPLGYHTFGPRKPFLLELYRNLDFGTSWISAELEDETHAAQPDAAVFSRGRLVSPIRRPRKRRMPV